MDKIIEHPASIAKRKATRIAEMTTAAKKHLAIVEENRSMPARLAATHLRFAAVHLDMAREMLIV